MRIYRSLSFLMLCSALFATAQESTTPFVLRIDHSTNDGRICTVITKDGKLRIEKSSPFQSGHPKIEEDVASADDMQRARAIDADLNRRRVDGTFLGHSNKYSNIAVMGSSWSIWFIEFDTNGKAGKMAFAQNEKQAPGYVRDVIAFQKELGKRKLPKLTGKVEPMCRPYHVEEIFGPPPKELQP